MFNDTVSFTFIQTWLESASGSWFGSFPCGCPVFCLHRCPTLRSGPPPSGSGGTKQSPVWRWRLKMENEADFLLTRWTTNSIFKFRSSKTPETFFFCIVGHSETIATIQPCKPSSCAVFSPWVSSVIGSENSPATALLHALTLNVMYRVSKRRPMNTNT